MTSPIILPGMFQTESTVADFGIPGVGGAHYQPKLKHRWRMTFAGLGDGVSQDLSLQLVRAARPELEFDEVQLDRYVNRSYVASKYTFSPMQFAFEDDVAGRSGRLLQQQIQKQQWLTGVEGPYLEASPEGSLYKFTAFLDMLDGRTQVIEKWTLEGCWLKSVNYGDLAYADSDQVVVEVTMRFDHANQDIGGYNAGPGLALRV